jgi:hypothetical protein
VRFTEWVKWQNREEIGNISSPGVYILGNFKRLPNGPANPVDENVIYIGETCDNTLKARWNQFHRSAFLFKEGHSGGIAYRNTIGDNGENLYVAAFAVLELPQDTKPLFIRFAERKLILEFALKNGKRPLCNSK